MSLTAVSFARGQSPRMCRNKAWTKLGGQTPVARAFDTVRGVRTVEIFIYAGACRKR